MKENGAVGAATLAIGERMRPDQYLKRDLNSIMKFFYNKLRMMTKNL